MNFLVRNMFDLNETGTLAAMHIIGYKNYPYSFQSGQGRDQIKKKRG